MYERYGLNNLNFGQTLEFQNIFKSFNQSILESFKPLEDISNYYRNQMSSFQNILNIPQINFMKDYSNIFQSTLGMQLEMQIEPIRSQLLQFQSQFKFSMQPILESIKDLQIDTDFDNLEDFTEEEKIEIQQDLASIEITQNWQQRICDIIAKWKIKNPIIVGLILFILFQLATGFIQLYGATIKSAFVREQPKKESTVIYQLEESQEVTIVDTIPYYYEIETINDKEVIKGWISKRSIKMIQIDSEK